MDALKCRFVKEFFQSTFWEAKDIVTSRCIHTNYVFNEDKKVIITLSEELMRQCRGGINVVEFFSDQRN